jgi:hypothetical protein
MNAILQKLKELIAELEPDANREAWSDREDFNAPDYSGGNFDDAYEGGVKDGETGTARYLLPRLMLMRNEIEEAMKQ